VGGAGNRFKRRVTVLCMSALAAVLALVHATVYFTGRRDMEAHLEESAKCIAVSVAGCIMMDIGEYRELLRTMDAGSAYYGRMQAYLASVKKSGGIRYIYTERKVDARTAEFVLDGEPVGGPDYSPPRQRDELDASEEAVYSTKAPAGYRSAGFGKWGRLLGAHAPILDECGEVLGIVGVDMDGSHIYGHLGMVNRALLLTYALVLGIGLASLLGFSDALVDRVFKDKLTGAYTKRYFEGLLDDEMAHAVRHGKGMGLMMMDLDHFKAVNDTYGHVFGDKVLAAVSEAIRGSMRPTDYFVRYGGEEFAVIVSRAGPRSVAEAAERMRRAVEDAPVMNEGSGGPVPITISIGVASFTNLSQSAKGLIEDADRALYRAKEKRNAVAISQ